MASILHALEQTDGSILTVTDQTDYTAAEKAPVGLKDKRLEISQYLKNKNRVVGEEAKFLVDMNPTQDYSVYTLKTRVDGAHDVDFSFIDVAGEYMEETHAKYKDLKVWVSESDVFIIAIDTPYMMQPDGDINEVYNRTTEITKVLSNIGDGTDPEVNKKLVIFCPVKCEKWVRKQEGQVSQADAVANKVKQSYRTLINTLIPKKGVDMWIMPIQTVGALDFVEMTDAYKYFKNSEDKTGRRCSFDKLTGLVRLEDGEYLLGVDTDHIEKNADSSRNNGLIDIPYAWYKVNEVGKYTPILCEQPAYHIIRFLVKKEQAIAKLQKEINDNSPWWRRIILWFTSPPFGQYIVQYQKVVDALERANKIKESGDGFVKITEIIH